MERKRGLWLHFLLALILSVVLTACSSADQEPNNEENAGAVPTEPAAESPTDIPIPELTATLTPVPIVHEIIPEGPVYFEQQLINDCATGNRLKEDGTIDIGLGCDRWEVNYLERPHDEGLANYLPQFDIVQAQMGWDLTWYYLRIITFPVREDNVVSDGVYAVEIDLDLDARGDILILVNDPSQQGADWDVTGVQVWLDANHDIGGSVALEPDESGGAGDGYETLLFDQGYGDDPDLVWARTDPEQPFIVEFAFKNTLIQEALMKRGAVSGKLLTLNRLQSGDLFEWWVWAASNLHPDVFDFTDHFGADELIILDNSCGWIFGGNPRNLPNICPYFVATPTPKPARDQEAPPQAEPETPAECQDPGYCDFWDQENCNCIIIN